MLVGSGMGARIWLSWKCIAAPALKVRVICVEREYGAAKVPTVVVVVFDADEAPVIVCMMFVRLRFGAGQ
jgi:hypothetical protein